MTDPTANRVAYLDDGDVQLYHGDAVTILQGLPAGIAQTCVTSPPYWGLRDYGTGQWTGGDPECDHQPPPAKDRKFTNGRGEGAGDEYAGSNLRSWTTRDGTPRTCRCGAQRVDSQLGLEATPTEYVTRLVALFREVRRVLRDDGTLWLNLGSSYVANPSGGMQGSTLSKGGRQTTASRAAYAARRDARPSDTPCTEPQDSRDPDSAYLDLCDGCAVEFLSRNFRSIQQIHEVLPHAGLIDPGTERLLDSEYGERLPAAPASTRPGSSLQPLGLCWRCGIQSASVVLPVPLTSSPDAQVSAHTASHIPDSDSPESDGRNQDTDASGMAWVNYTRSLKRKDMVPIPWMVAMALQADGWYLRSDIIWSKPDPMPESVTDRPTKAHEYLFLLSKGPRYFYDADSIREPANPAYASRYDSAFGGAAAEAGRTSSENGIDMRTRPIGTREFTGARNRRSVWTIPTEPFPEAHFATYPQGLVRPCILAGTSEHGGCIECGAPWRRQTTVDYEEIPGGSQSHNHTSPKGATGMARATMPHLNKRVETMGWEPSCACIEQAIHDDPTPDQLVGRVQAQLVLDPFVGSGTTALVARKHGRRCIGIDLSAEYLAIAAKRTQQLSLLGGVA